MPQEAKWAISLVVGVGLVWLGWKFSPILVTLHIIVGLVLILVIMLQSGSAADLAGAFGGAGSQTAFGPRGAATLLSKATTWCAIIFMMTSLSLSVKRSPSSAPGYNSIIQETQKPAPATPQAPPKSVIQQTPPKPATAPAPAPAPAQQSPTPKK